MKVISSLHGRLTIYKGRRTMTVMPAAFKPSKGANRFSAAVAAKHKYIVP